MCRIAHANQTNEPSGQRRKRSSFDANGGVADCLSPSWSPARNAASLSLGSGAPAESSVSASVNSSREGSVASPCSNSVAGTEDISSSIGAADPPAAGVASPGRTEDCQEGIQSGGNDTRGGVTNLRSTSNH